MLLKTNLQRSLFALVFLTIAAAFLFFYPSKKENKFLTNDGNVFGTQYHIVYNAEQNLSEQIVARMQQIDQSLSIFNEQSIISLVNTNQEVKTDADFEAVFNRAAEISELSYGAFDITVAPIVNVWGFGFSNKENVSQATIDSLLSIIGYERVRLVEHHVVKDDPRIMLNASAIAKGYACDAVAQLLRDNGVTDFLVEIGGEVVTSGVNEKGEQWRIGIDKPEDDPTGQSHGLQAVVEGNLCMATSGNYRQYYYEDGEKRTHTIDPRTGYPVNHNLLSATIIAPDCMTADALATACMVKGEVGALQMVENLPNVECYLIVSDSNGEYTIMQSDGFAKYLGKF